MTALTLARRCTFLALALALLAPATLVHARSTPDPDKYARKIEKKLAHYKKGALLHVVFANNSDSTGSIGQLGDHSFTLVNVETNATETHNYADVYSVGKGSDSIGQGAGKHHHRPF
jgi:hypothetical protein